jgi:ABC-type multidrug transport system ATPase subunit
LIVIAACALFWYLGRTNKGDIGTISLGDNDSPDDPSKAAFEHKASTLAFDELSYTAPSGKTVLSGVCGTAQPGQLLAIIGASGAGKSTLLDILAKKNKRGSVHGKVTVNGKAISSQQYRRLVGFVDQEDTLMGTLTVYETVLYSALLRLPRDLSLEAKKLRVLETLDELGILGIKDSRIGESGKRSISGGEKRRVSIACELVTSPAILFLDEPTSGLDAFNAKNVVECLSTLARTHNRTVVFTIHQPRSNIVTLFDQLLLLAAGRVVYAGAFAACQGYFEGIGHPCPSGYNIADFLIDLTMQEEEPLRSASTIDGGDEETRGSGGQRLVNRQSRTHVAALADAYSNSDIAKEIKRKGSNGHTADAPDNSASTAGEFKRASWWTQFTILSGRAFKNLYRNPMLMLSHYAISIFVALLCSFLFAHVT